MGKDLRKMLQEKRDSYTLPDGHEERFLSRLDEKLPRRKRKWSYYQLAAAIALLIVGGLIVFFLGNREEAVPEIIVDKQETGAEPGGITLGDLSPDLAKVENYYVTNINMELARLKISQDNKAVVDQFMERLAVLNNDYRKLNAELNDLGPNDQTIAALIHNLQLRLDLLQKLKSQLNSLKSSENEHTESNSV